MRNKFFAFLFLTFFPFVVYSATPEKTIQFNASTGHVHNGSAGGKKISASNVINVPASSVAATNVQDAINELNTEKINTSEKGAASGVAGLDVSTKIPAIYLPAIAITDIYVCGSLVCQLALDVEEGDACVRTDENKTYIHNGGVTGTIVDWTLLLATGVVTSVNGDIGAIANVEKTTNRQTTLTNDDSKYPTSGAVVDYAATTGHDHTLSNLSGAVTDGQVPNTITVDTATNADTVDGSHASAFAGSSHDHTLSNLSGAVTDGQVPNTITVDTATNADTVDTKHFADIQSDTAGQITTHTSSASAHHSSTSNGLALTPLSVVASGGVASSSAMEITGTDNGAFYKLNATTTSGSFIYTDIAAEAYARFLIDNSGVLNWGAGTVTRDTNLYRLGANNLATDDVFTAAGGLTTTSGVEITGTDNGAFYKLNATTTNGYFIYSDIAEEASARFLINNSGQMEWGIGSAARDVVLGRSATNTLALSAGDSFTVDTSANYAHGTTTKHWAGDGTSMRLATTNPGAFTTDEFFTAAATDSLFDYGVLPVHLPVGAIIVSFYAKGYTDTGANNNVGLTLYRQAAGTLSSMGNCSFFNEGFACSDSTITNATVGSGYSYFFHVEAKMSGANDAMFYDVTITYTTTDLSQTQ